MAASTMFIQTEVTPDPAKMKFLPGREVFVGGTLNFCDRSLAAKSPLAEKLFAIPGVSGVSFARRSIVVTKTSGDWQHLKPVILGTIMDHFISEDPLLRDGIVTEGLLDHSDSERVTAERIREALRQVIDPEIGYNIVDLGFVYEIVLEGDGLVKVTMTTTTPGCPATSYLKTGVTESVLALPTVERVEVNLTFEPRWTHRMMSRDAQAYLGTSDVATG